MFVGGVGAVINGSSAGAGSVPAQGQFLVWIADHAGGLWFTLLLRISRSHAEGRGKASGNTAKGNQWKLADGKTELLRARIALRRRRSCGWGEFVPGDGEVIEGVASVTSPAITGESAPVIRESEATARQ